LKGLALILFAVTFTSCEDNFKELPEASSLNKKNSNRLEFASPEALQAALKTFYKAENKDEVLEDVINTYTINGNHKRFKSLLDFITVA
jgi:hypothetical protein